MDHGNQSSPPPNFRGGDRTRDREMLADLSAIQMNHTTSQDNTSGDSLRRKYLFKESGERASSKTKQLSRPHTNSRRSPRKKSRRDRQADNHHNDTTDSPDESHQKVPPGVIKIYPPMPPQPQPFAWIGQQGRQAPIVKVIERISSEGPKSDGGRMSEKETLHGMMESLHRPSSNSKTSRGARRERR